MIRNLLIALVLLVATGDTLTGQARDGRGPDHGPVARLMRMQAELQLTGEQIARLQEIDRQMDQQNQPLVMRLSELRRQLRALGPPDRLAPERRAEFDTHVGEFRRLMRQIERNNHAAMKDVGAVLTHSQKESIGKLLRTHQNGERRNRPSSPRGRN